MIKYPNSMLLGKGRAYLAKNLKLQFITEGKPRQEFEQPVTS